MWSKGAVVIVKRGDKNIADAISRGLDIHTTVYTTPLHRRTQAEWAEMTRKLEHRYGPHRTHPKWVRGLLSLHWGAIYYITKLGELTCKLSIRIGRTFAKNMASLKTRLWRSVYRCSAKRASQWRS